MTDQIETGDIFKGAYFLCHGGKLTKIRVECEDHVVFTFRGEELDQEDMRYRTNAGMVSPLHLKENLNLLRDKIFSTLRKNNKDGRNHHGAYTRTRA